MLLDDVVYLRSPLTASYQRFDGLADILTRTNRLPLWRRVFAFTSRRVEDIIPAFTNRYPML